VDEFYTLKELSKQLKLSTDTIYRMVRKGKIPAVKIGKKWRFRKSRIDEWLLLEEKNTELKTKKR
jgi:excisionase family DNA binding protein